MNYYAGIDLGGTFVKCGIVDECGRIAVKDKIPTGAKRDYRAIARDMAGLASSLAQKAGVELTAVGIGAPGTIDSKNGVVVYSNNIKWDKIPLAGEIFSIMCLPVAMTNDANAAALGESFAGGGKEFDTTVFLTLGTGVGGGIVINGELYEGGYSAGAEIGHIMVKPNGKRCTCGRRGCLEAYASATALTDQTRSAMLRDRGSVLWKLAGGNIDAVDGKTAFDGARVGDPTAVRVIDKYIGYLADGVIDIINIFRPDAVILGGGVCAAGDMLIVPLRKKVCGAVFGGMSYAPVQILAAELGNDAGVVGAARLAMLKAGGQ